MTHSIIEMSPNKLARFAGFGYLIIFITGFFSNFFVLESMISTNNPTKIAENITDLQPLFRAGIASFIVMVIFDLLLAWAFYVLLKPVSESLSLLAAWLRLVNATIFGVALYHLLNVVQLTSKAVYLREFTGAQIHSQMMLSLKSFEDTWLLGLVFFALHLSVLGYLIVRSNFIPKLLGMLLIVASVGYLTDSLAHFLLVNYQEYESLFAAVVFIPGVIAELSLCLWLLFKGVSVVSANNDDELSISP